MFSFVEKTLLFLLSAICVYANEADRVNFVAKSFERSLIAGNGAYGGVCVVANGQTLLAKTFVNGALKKGDKVPDVSSRAFPLGKTSWAIMSLAAESMSYNGKIDLNIPASQICSLFAAPEGAEKTTTLANMLSMRAGFDSSADKLMPVNTKLDEFFGVVAQTQIVRADGRDTEYSAICAASAGYVMAYAHKKNPRGLKKAFVNCVEKYLFKPLNIDARYCAYETALFPANAFALTITDCSKWLEAETSASTKVALPEKISSRRISMPECRYGAGWLNTTLDGLSVQMIGGYFQNCANIVAVFPSLKMAVGIFAVGNSKDAPKICAATLQEFSRLYSPEKQKNFTK